MLSSYRALLGRDHVPSLAIACGLAWLSFSGYGLAIILAVHAGTHSFTLAGGAVAAFSAGSGILAPVRGRAIDRRGPRMLAQLATAHLLCSALLVLACARREAHLFVVPAAALAGACAPPLIATARSMWTDAAGPALARTAHALNAALADGAQVASPALTGALALAISPAFALAVLVLGAVVAAWLLAIGGHRHASEPARPDGVDGHRVWGVLHESAGLRTIVAGDFALGGSLAGLEVALTALAAHRGAPELAALPLATSALGSIGVSIWSGTGLSARRAGSRYLIGSVVVAAVVPLTLLANSMAAVSLVLVLVGGGFGLLNVAVFELIDRVAPQDRRAEAFTWLTTGQAAGAAIGAAVAGRLAQGGAPTASLLVVVAFAALAAAIAFVRRRSLTAGA